MKTVAICSLMRAGSTYERAYYLQILSLAQNNYRIHSVNVIYDVEPLESRWLRDLLEANGVRVSYEIESVKHVDFKTFADKSFQWAALANQAIDLALKPDDPCSHIAWIEADLCYPYDVLDILTERSCHIVAPLIYLGNIFYDSWGFRDKTGEKIFSFPPRSPAVQLDLIPLDTVGSFVLFDANIFRSGIRFPGGPDGLLVGVCRAAKEKGFDTFADPQITILHPVTAWREQTWAPQKNTIFFAGEFESEHPMSGRWHAITDDVVQSWAHQFNWRGAAREVKVIRTDGARTFELEVYITPYPWSQPISRIRALVKHALRTSPANSAFKSRIRALKRGIGLNRR